MLLIGDHHQLSTVIKSDQTVFAPTCQLFMFERLVRAGTPYIQLKEQFRMPPHISSIVNWRFLTNRDEYHHSSGVTQFQEFVRA